MIEFKNNELKNNYRISKKCNENFNEKKVNRTKIIIHRDETFIEPLHVELSNVQRE